MTHKQTRIENLPTKKLIGQRLRMSLAENKTFELWRGFMPRRKEIPAVNTVLYSMQVYDPSMDFKNFNPNTVFDKWAAVEVDNLSVIPDGMESYLLTGGLYAVFIHKGPPSAFPKTFEYIFHQWLPNSDYQLDDREHFELLGDKYKNNEPDSEEEVWIPIKVKRT